MNIDHYTYRVTWSSDDGEHVGLCIEFPSLSWLAQTPEEALKGIRRTVAKVVSLEERRRKTEDGIEILPYLTFAKQLWSGMLI